MELKNERITKDDLNEIRKKGKKIYNFDNIADFQNSVRNAYAAAKSLSPKKFEIRQIPRKGIVIICRTE